MSLMCQSWTFPPHLALNWRPRHPLPPKVLSIAHLSMQQNQQIWRQMFQTHLPQGFKLTCQLQMRPCVMFSLAIWPLHKLQGSFKDSSWASRAQRAQRFHHPLPPHQAHLQVQILAPTCHHSQALSLLWPVPATLPIVNQLWRKPLQASVKQAQIWRQAACLCQLHPTSSQGQDQTSCRATAPLLRAIWGRPHALVRQCQDLSQACSTKHAYEASCGQEGICLVPTERLSLGLGASDSLFKHCCAMRAQYSSRHLHNRNVLVQLGS